MSVAVTSVGDDGSPALTQLHATVSSAELLVASLPGIVPRYPLLRACAMRRRRLTLLRLML
jgi:hypothetical protein